MSSNNEVPDGLEGNDAHRTAVKAVEEYLEAHSPIYLELRQLRAKGWDSAEADRYFAEQQREAEDDSAEARLKLHKRMMTVAKDMQRHNNAFTIKPRQKAPRICDLSMVPGAFLTFAWKKNPKATLFVLNNPTEDSGINTKLVDENDMHDIAMLAGDMGLDEGEIPQDHPDADEFIHSRLLQDQGIFDLVICDSTIQPLHHTHREFRRLLLTQLVLGLKHLRKDGTMIVQLHKVEGLHTIRLLSDFNKFAKLRVFKHYLWSDKLSSFYMVASKVRSTSKKAREAVQEWKRQWKVATLGTEKEWRDERARLAAFGDLGVEGALEEFGPTLVRLGRKIWDVQAEALKKAPFMKN